MPIDNFESPPNWSVLRNFSEDISGNLSYKQFLVGLGVDNQITTRIAPFTKANTLNGATLNIDFSQETIGAITFSRASSAYRVSKLGVFELVGNNIPRYDYNPTTLQFRGLLIEESRTNLLTYSEQFDNGAWVKFNSSVTANVATAPNGATLADRLTDNSTYARHYLLRTLSVSANTFYTLSIFAKADTNNFVSIVFGKYASPYTRGGSIVNLTTGEITSYSSNSPLSVNRFAAEKFDNGWWRITVSVVFDTTSTDGIVEIGTLNAAISSATYSGSGGSIYIWGAQLEVGNYPTSYIPTTTTSAIRAADVATISSISSWYKSGQGTLGIDGYFMGSPDNNYPVFVGLTDASTLDVIGIWNSPDNSKRISAVIRKNVNSPTFLSAFGSAKSYGVSFSAAIRFDSYSATFAIDGELGSESFTIDLPVPTQLLIGSPQLYQTACSYWLKRLFYMPRKVTGTELQTLSVFY